VTTAEETTQDTPTTTFKRCFSGSGKFANRKWAPGGDATYLSRLRKAHLADETLPDPWYIQEHGGVEADNVPEDGWPQLSAMDIAQRLDQERGAGVESHWAATLEGAKEKAAQKDQARSERRQIHRGAQGAEVEPLANRATDGDLRPSAGDTPVGHDPELAGLVTEPVGAAIGGRVAVDDRAGHTDLPVPEMRGIGDDPIDACRRAGGRPEHAERQHRDPHQREPLQRALPIVAS